ncbi:MAG TPA: amino acid ABC transporter permease [Anaerolineales bacterium]|nr:amino acid ABC transporter permease [Anaerolineales bacterium]
MAQARTWTVPPPEPPPALIVGPIGWLRRNLFSTWGNSLLTVISGGAILVVGRASLGWIFGEANWQVVTRNLRVLTWGRYPASEVWRLGLALGLMVALGVLSGIAWRRPAAQLRRLAVIGWIASPFVLALILYGLVLPTPATIANNLGYYIYRPDVLASLGHTWRAPLALAISAALAGFTLGIGVRRVWRFLALAPLAAVAGLNLAQGIALKIGLAGLAVPSLLVVGLIAAATWFIGSGAGKSNRNLVGLRRGLAIAWIIAVPALLILLTSFEVGVDRVAPAEVLPLVDLDLWSGVMLTMVLAVVSIAASFPIGVLLALGRRSSLPVVRGFSILFIEIIRGVPLIAILFMAQNLLPLFLPLQWDFDRVVRAMAGMIIFTAAYLAEVVRGGLQAVRHEQVEAARALGLSELLVTGLVILPQALRAVIPAIMGQFVSIFKDTSLVSIVGLLDLLAICQSITKQREFLGTVREVYLFAAVFYFVVSFSMSEASRRLERRLGVGLE